MRVLDISKTFALTLGTILGGCNLFAEDLEITATVPQEGMAKFEVKFDQDAQISDFTVCHSRFDGWGEPTIARNGNNFSITISSRNLDVAVLDGNGFRFMFHLDGSVDITKTSKGKISNIKVVSPQYAVIKTNTYNNDGDAVDLEKLSANCNSLFFLGGGYLRELEANCKEIRSFAGRTNIEKMKLLGEDISVFASITPLKSFSCPNARQLTIGRGVKMSEGCAMDINKNAQVFKD